MKVKLEKKSIKRKRNKLLSSCKSCPVQIDASKKSIRAEVILRATVFSCERFFVKNYPWCKTFFPLVNLK